jgi:amino acid transporter
LVERERLGQIVSRTPVISEPAAHPAADGPPSPHRDGYEPASASWPLYRLKGLVLGPPLQTKRLVHERLRKLLALAVFSSDAISSTAYGTEQVMLPLLVAGSAAVALTFPISIGIAGLLVILILSYRQTILAYPSAGGAYVVTRDNFGIRLAQVAGAALLIDYVLTVAVSVAGGIAAVVTGAPSLAPFTVPLSIACIALITWGNLRGVRESGRIFAVPTYVYVGSLGLVVLLGLFRHVTGHLPPIPASQTGPLPRQTATIGLLLLMHAYASGCTALTGVEAISNGVPAFRRPEAINARRTLVAMGTILGTLFLGVSFLAVTTHELPYPGGNPTVVGQLAGYILDARTSNLGHAAFEFVQAATLLILVLAANTSFADFPRLASFAAGDAFMPRQFLQRGHRLVFSNGILTLAGAATVLLVAFKANINSLIPLYAIGVFVSFTMSQAGMTRRHLRLREPGWRYGLVVNGLGALVTFVVLGDVISTKFTHGAWMVLVALPILVALLYRTNRAYSGEVAELKVELSQALAPPKPRHEVVVLVEGLTARRWPRCGMHGSFGHSGRWPSTSPSMRRLRMGCRCCGPSWGSRCRWRWWDRTVTVWGSGPRWPSWSLGGRAPTPRSRCCCRGAPTRACSTGCAAAVAPTPCWRRSGAWRGCT